MSESESDAQSLASTTGPAGSTTDTGAAVIITGSSAEGRQTFSPEWGKHQRQAAAEEHKRQLEREEAEHALGERRKDNDLRRFCVQVIIIVVLVFLVGSAIVALANSDPTVRPWAENIVTTLIGGLLGGVVGYFTGKSNA